MPRCPHCQNNCARDADACPRCGKKKPGQNLLGIVLVILFILYLISKDA